MSNQLKPKEDRTDEKNDTEKKGEESQSETGDDMASKLDKKSGSEDSGTGSSDSDCDRFKLLPLPPKRKQLKKKKLSWKRRRESSNYDSSLATLPLLHKNWHRTIDELTCCISQNNLFMRLTSLSLNDTIADQLVPMETQMAEPAEPKVPPNTPEASQNLNMMEVDESY